MHHHQRFTKKINYDKLDGIVYGEFQIEVDGTKHKLKTGDTIQIPRGVYHSIKAIDSGLIYSVILK